MTTTVPVLTIEEAAPLLRVTVRTLQRLARLGRVPCIKVGGEWRFPADIVERMMSGRVATTWQPRGNHVDQVERTAVNHVAGVH